MDKRTLKALKGSIKKWEKIVDGTGTDKGPDNCPLCKLFFDSTDCLGCPVNNATGKTGCRGTPYDDYSLAADKHVPALAELDFLKSLLPQNPPAHTECTCGASVDGKWADVHDKRCPAVAHIKSDQQLIDDAWEKHKAAGINRPAPTESAGQK